MIDKFAKINSKNNNPFSSANFKILRNVYVPYRVTRIYESTKNNRKVEKSCKAIEN